MRTPRLTLVALAAALLAALSVPSPADAGTITYRISNGSELAVDFTQSGAEIWAAAEQRFSTTSYSEGDFRLFDDGLATMNLFAYDPDGNPVEGNFTTRATNVSIFVDEFRECEPDEEADDCQDPPFSGSRGVVLITFGPGRFDPQIATLLGIRPNTLGGDMDIFLDGIDGGPNSPRRSGFSSSGYAYLNIFTEEVPEPGLLAMGAIGVVAAAARRRRRR
jgi:MYXO-CTERM domain-containing protein